MNGGKTSSKAVLDKPVYFTSMVVILFLAAMLWFFPNQAKEITLKVKDWILEYYGFMYTWIGFASVIACAFFAFSKYGNIKFGALDEKPAFSNFQWAASVFTAGIAVAILYSSATEWINYYSEPGLFIEPYSALAAEHSGAYALFHWTVTPWAIYVLSALPIGYSYFVRKKPILKVSEVCRDLLGDRVDGWIGKAIDIFFILAIVMGAATDIGIGVPLVTAAISSILNIEVSVLGSRLVCLAITALFLTTATLGLKKGMARLSSVNTVLALILLALILLFGPTLFIIKMTTTSLGIFTQEFIRMSTWMDPVTNGGFPDGWTQFYWAWWLSTAPLIGMFIARISKGRSIRNVLCGTILFGSMGCGMFLMIFGNFEMSLQLTGEFDIISQFLAGNGPSAVIDSLHCLPDVIAILCTLIIIVVGICFSASTYDSVTYCYAASSMLRLKDTETPPKWLIF